MGAILRWDDTYCTGIADVDAQHRGLFELVNELLEARNAGIDSDIIEPVLGRLVDYTVVHFAAEEAYFGEYDYLEADEHLQQHRDFVGKVALFQKELGLGEATLTMEVWDFLSSWLLDHVLGFDRRFGRFMRDQGQV